MTIGTSIKMYWRGRTMTVGRLIAFRNDRLGARLLSLVNAQRLAIDLDLPYAMRWPESIGVGSEFNTPEDLFDPAFVAENFIDASDWNTARPKTLKLNGASELTRADLKASVQAGQSYTVELAFGFIVLADENEQDVRDKCAALFRQIPLGPRLTAISHQLDGHLRGTTAYHVRRGDLVSDLRAKNRSWLNKVVPIEFYLQHLDRETTEGHGLVLFSDDTQLVAQLQEQYPAAKRLAELIDYSQLTQGEIDFLELWAMGHCAKIIAPAGSAFSSTASELGEVPMTDVKDDLDTTRSGAAYEAILQRLRTIVPNDENDGQIAQDLLHLKTYLEAQSRTDEMAALVKNLISKGLNISFVFPLAVDLLLNEGDFSGAAAVARPASGAQPYHDKDFVKLLIREAAALAALGKTGEARRTLQTAISLDPLNAELSRIVPISLVLGGLNDHNFLPVSADVLQLSGRAQAFDKSGSKGLIYLSHILPDGADQSLVKRGALEPILWDWARLLNCQNKIAPSLNGMVGKRLIDVLGKFEARGNLPNISGTQAVLFAHQGKLGRALALIDKSLGLDPTVALTHQRKSHIHWVRGEFQKAAAAAVEATRLSDAPAYLAWAGMCSDAARDREAAFDFLKAAYNANTGFPSIPGAFSRVARRTGRTDIALEALEVAEDLAPNNGRFVTQRAHILHEKGDVNGAISALDGLILRNRLPMPGYQLLCDLYVSKGQMHAAREVLSHGLNRKPDHARLQEKLAALG